MKKSLFFVVALFSISQAVLADDLSDLSTGQKPFWGKSAPAAALDCAKSGPKELPSDHGSSRSAPASSKSARAN